MKIDYQFFLRCSLARLISTSLSRHKYTKKSRTFELLGCEYEFFMLYLGDKPKGDYHLDHICPCKQAKNEEELIKLQHYSNLRWLPARDNLQKQAAKTKAGEYKCKQLLKRDWID